MNSKFSFYFIVCLLLSPLPLHALITPSGTIEHSQIVDTDGDGLADPGDIIRFTIKITNSSPAPFEGMIALIDTYAGATILENSITSSQGTFTRNGREITLTLGTLAPSTIATFVYDQSVNGPVGFELAKALCGNGTLKFPDNSSTQLQAINGAQLGLGSCVQKVDFDDDEIIDSEDLCINVPHSSAKVDLVIPSSGGTPLVINNSINITRKGTITSSDVGLMIKHSWVGDVKVRLTHVNTGTSVLLLDRPGVPASTFGCSGDNIACNFSMSGFPTAENTCGSSVPVISGLFSPQESLNAFNGESMSGEWKLTVEDLFPAGDGGSLTQWCLNLKGATEISTSIVAPAKSLNTNRFVQRLNVTNNGPSDLLDFSIDHFIPFGLTLKKASLISSGTPGPLPALSAIPVGNSLIADFEVEPTVSYPYREVIVSSPASIASSYDAVFTPLSTELSTEGISGQLVLADILSNAGNCTLQNGPALQGNIALIPLVFCQTQNLVNLVVGAGAQAAIMRLNYPLDPILLAKPIPLINSVTIPVIAMSNTTFDFIANASGSKQAKLRANPERKIWNLTSSIRLNSPRAEITNLFQPTDSLRTTTEIQVDSDLDGAGDIDDLCNADPAKSAPGTCGCGIADKDSDGDGSFDCIDQCLSDPLKSIAGTCGCGIPESDREPNGIVDCSTGREVYARYTTLNSLVSGVKRVVLTGNKKKDAAKRRALRARILKIKTILSEIDGLVINPFKTILLSDPTVNLASESLSAKNKVLAALKVNAKKFSKNKKSAVSSIQKILGLVINSD